MKAAAPYARLLAGLGTLLLERQAGRKFTLPGTPPEWFLPFLPRRAARTVEPGQLFPFLDHFLDDAEPLWAAADGQVLRSGVWSETAPEGHELHFEATACTVESRSCLLIQHLTTGYDHLQRALQKGRELSLAHERLVAEIGKKEILLHCIVHDLSAPLQGMTSSLEIAQDEVHEPRVKRLVGLGLLAARQQTNLIQDLLDTFRAETSGHDAISADPATAPDIVACAEEIITLIQPALSVRGLTAEVRAPKGLRTLPVLAEKSRLDRVFYNLLQNAMRHSPKGSKVIISLRKEADGFVRIAIKDEGPGVPPEVVPQLFQKFVRHGRGKGKAGLGLFFCRITVEQWGGAIGCQPRKSGGTTFWFRLKSL